MFRTAIREIKHNHGRALLWCAMEPELHMLIWLGLVVTVGGGLVAAFPWLDRMLPPLWQYLAYYDQFSTASATVAALAVAWAFLSWRWVPWIVGAIGYFVSPLLAEQEAADAE